jgi:hypothetical protein
MDMRFGTWRVQVISLYRAGSLRAVTKEILKFKLNIVGVHEVREDRCGTEPAGDYSFLYGKEMRIMNYVQISSYVRESYQQLRG